jgi:hypothetical protein
MSFAFRHLAVVAGVVALIGCGGSEPARGVDPPPVDPVWQLPTCATVQGSSVIAYSPDEGITLRPPGTPPAGQFGEGVSSIVAVPGVANRFLATYQVVGSPTVTEAILFSPDSGCSWAVATQLQASNSVQLVPGGSDIVYGWIDNFQNTSDVVAVDSMGRVLRSTRFPQQTLALAASTVDPTRLRHVGGVNTLGNGTVSESRDGGTSWSQLSLLPLEATGSNPVAIDPTNLDRIAIAGQDGTLVTSNAGSTWVASTFDGTSANSIVIYWMTFSSDGQILWAHGRNLDEFAANAPNDGRHLWQSTNGGISFTPVLEQSGTTLINGILRAHPTDPDILYWITYLPTDPAISLFRYSKSNATVTRTSLPGFASAKVAAFHPLDPRTMYFGLDWPPPEG